MMEKEALDLMFLLFFCVVEMVGYAYFLNELERRQEKRGDAVVCFALTVGCLFLWAMLSMTENNTRDIYSYIYTLEYYMTIVVWLLVVYKVSVKEAIYHTVLILLATRALRHCFGHIMIVTLFYNYLVEGDIWFFRCIACLFLLMLYIILFSVLKKFLIPDNRQKISCLHMALVLSVILPVVYIGALAESLQNQWGRGMDAILLEIVASVCGMFSVLGYRWMLEARRQESELAHMEEILKLQHRQYETKKETMDLINQKYHDLKKSLHYLQQHGADNSNHVLKNLQNELCAYETIFQTGNETLDIVLFDKNERCLKSGIRMIFMLDGVDLSFLDPLDITAIFGNALDNAIEQAQKMEYTDQREVTMKCSSRPGWLVLRFENYCDPTKLCWENGVLRTTKGDPQIHGFGLDSIEYATKKHGGNMTIDLKENKFVLKIMFPQ